MKLPKDRSMQPGPISQVLVNSDHARLGTATLDVQFCKQVLDLFSLAFEEEAFQLPTFHSLPHLRHRQHRICFEELMFTRKSFLEEDGFVSYKRTRTENEADDIRKIAYRKCRLSTALYSVQVDQTAAVRNLLFFERRQNRRITNARELCEALDGPAWRTRLFVEPADLDFCAQVEQAQWADVIVSKIGAQVEYVGFARRGTVLILVHTAPVVNDRGDFTRIVQSAGIRILDFIDNSRGPITESNVAMDGRLANLVYVNFYWNFCKRLNFASLQYGMCIILLCIVCA